MGRYEFKVVVSGVELSEDQQKRIGQAVSLAGAGAIGKFIPQPPVSVPLSLLHYWMGPYPPAILKELDQYAQGQAG